MRDTMRRSRKLLTSLGLVAVMAVGVFALITDASAKRPPGPLCGPTILFECTFRDGSTELVGLTRCEVDRYEKKNKATCVPAS